MDTWLRRYNSVPFARKLLTLALGSEGFSGTHLLLEEVDAGLGTVTLPREFV